MGAGGNWQTQAWYRLLATMKNSIQSVNKEAVLSSEGTIEGFLPWMDLAYSRDTTFESFHSEEAQAGWEPIPLYDYVYRPWVNFLDQFSYALTPSFYPDYQMVGLGRTFVWGHIPGYSTPPPGQGRPVNAAAFAFIQKIATARTTFAKKYLMSGVMLPPPSVESPLSTAAYFINGSGSLSASQEFPAVPSAAWKAPDGDVGIALANTDDQPVQVQVAVHFKRLGLDSGSTYTACLLRTNGGAQLARASGPETTYTLQLDPFDVGILELTTRAKCRPVLTALVSASSFTAPVAPGSLVSIFGTGLSSKTDKPPGFPLPTSLQNFSGSVDNTALPLAYASPEQFNAQLPSKLSPGVASLTVRTESGDATFPFTVAASAPGIFIFGANRAVAQNPDYSVNDKNNPAAVGDYLTVYLTGVGPFDNPVADGVATPFSPYSRATLPASASIEGVNAPIAFLGLTPTFAGLVQANIQVPEGLSGRSPLGDHGGRDPH